MKKEITLGQVISIVAVMTMSMLGWGVSVEVRLATFKTQIDMLQKMDSKMDDIYKATVGFDARLKYDPAFQTRGGKTKK